jgi:hypothetical protein
MSINLRLSAASGGTRNTFDQTVNFSSYGGSPGASAATNTAAISSFNTAYAALSGRTQLIINPGTYNFNGYNFADTPGIAGSKLTISAFGVTLSSTSGTQGVAIVTGIIQGADNAKETRINTVSAGTNTVTLKTAGETSRFSVGQYCCVSGINMQGAGDPPNLGIFEYAKIQSIGTGTLTFTTPLVNSYKDTWPVYSAGRGGPATVFPMQGFWDQEVEFKGARFTDTGNLTYGKTRVMRWTDCLFDTYGPCPSVNSLCQINRCDINGFGGLEVDKDVQRLEILDSSVRAVDFQSAGVNEVYVSNVNQSNVSGTPRWNGGGCVSNTFINLTTGTGGVFRFGPQNYGAMGPTTMTNCSAPSSTWFDQTTPFSDMTEEGAGVLSYAGGPGAASNAFHWWATPGANAVLLDSSNGWARSFQISDVSQSGGRTYITTNLPFPLPSTINAKSAPFKILAHPCADLTMTSCTGNSLFTTQSGLPAHTPFQSWTL